LCNQWQPSVMCRPAEPKGSISNSWGKLLKTRAAQGDAACKVTLDKSNWHAIAMHGTVLL
jgi:hypothetical protein